MSRRKNLKDITLSAIDDIREVYEVFHWESPRAYSDWLAQSYYIARHTTRLMATALARCPMDRQPILDRLFDNLFVERGNDRLLLDDLKVMGWSLRELPEDPLTSAFYETLYYGLEHRGVEALFGRILVLEGIASTFGVAHKARVEKAHGGRAVSFLSIRADDDPDMLERAFDEAVELSDNELSVARSSVTQGTVLYRLMMDRIMIRTSKEEGE